MASYVRGTEGHTMYNSIYGMSRKGKSTEAWKSSACLIGCDVYTILLIYKHHQTVQCKGKFYGMKNISIKAIQKLSFFCSFFLKDTLFFYSN